MISAVNFPKYTVTFKNDDGTVLEKKTVALGQIPTYTKETPIKPDSTKEQYYDYDFIGWDKQFASTITDTTYTATYNKTHQVYEVIYYDEDGKTILDKQKVNRGEEPIYKGVVPIKQVSSGLQYRFSGWKASGSQETGSIIFVATYDSAMEGLQINENGLITGYTGKEINIKIPEKFGGITIKEIAANAFAVGEGINKIESIELPDTIETINVGAFANLTSLKTIKFPNNDNFTEISDYLFFNCTSIKEIKLPNSIVKVGSNSFNGCNELSKIEFGDNLVDINTDFFTGCDALKEVYISDKNPRFKTNDTHNLILSNEEEPKVLIRCLPASNSVTIPNSIEVLTAFSFYKCKNLTTINLGDNVKQIFEGAFEGCTNLTEFNTGNSVEELGDNLFKGCDKLSKIIFGKNVKTINGKTLSGCASLTTIIVDPQNECYSNDEAGLLYDKNQTKLIKCPQNVTSVNIPTDSKLVTIGTYSFENCIISTINIPSNIKTIESYAFSNCHNINNIYLGDGVTKVEGYVINGCSSLTKATIGASLTYDGFDIYTLQGCTTLEEIDVSTSNPTLMSVDGILCSKSTSNDEPTPIEILRCPYKYDFSNTDGNYVIPKSVISLKPFAFSDVIGLKRITIHDDVKTMGQNALSAPNLTTITIDGYGVDNFVKSENISDKVFANSKLENIELTKVTSDTYVIIDTFYKYYLNKERRLNIKILSSVEQLSNKVFSNCTSFKKIEFEEGLKIIGESAFARYQQLTEINLPTSIISIGNYAFSGCYGLTNLPSLPNVESIGDYCFYDCISFKTIDFTNSNKLESIGNQSFRRCTNLNSLSFSNLKKIGNFAIVDNPNLETLVLGNNITSIGEYGIANNVKLNSIFLPRTLFNVSEQKLNISKCAFQQCSNLVDVTFDGTITEFETAYKKSDNIFYLCGVTKIKCLGVDGEDAGYYFLPK